MLMVCPHLRRLRLATGRPAPTMKSRSPTWSPFGGSPWGLNTKLNATSSGGKVRCCGFDC